ncbi:WD1261 family protein [Wolbachia endosymbiont of Protocalliphora sialia]
MVKEIEELIKIVGKGNLLEALFIFLGNFQHANLHHCMDYRNHIGLSEFINKKEQEPLDKYFNLKFSLQGLFLIYTQAYKILSGSNNPSTQDIIDEIYKVIKESELGKDIHEIVDGRKLDLLNALANPKRESIFKTVEDFESKVLISVRKLLSEENALNEYDREFALNKCIIDLYYSIHQDIKVDSGVVLLFSILGNYHKLSEYHKESIKKENLPIIDNMVVLTYIVNLAVLLQSINLKDQNRAIKYTLDCGKIGTLNRTFNISASARYNDQGFLFLKRVGPILKQLLKEQNSNKFEERIINNTHYSAPQEENECRPNFILSKQNHKNTFCKLILGMFVLSVGLYVADYFLMEQKLFNPIKGVLPQDNFANLVIAAMLTIVIVYALSQLLKPPQEPPLSTVDGAIINDLTNGPIQSRRS